MKKILTHLFHKYTSILFGAILFSIYIWVKFIRERLPKEIPFASSLVGILIIIEICCIFIFILYTLIKKEHKPSPISIEIMNLIYKPLIDFDTYIKNISWIQHYHKNFIVAFAYGSIYLFKHTELFFILFAIMPRIILVIALVIDTFIYAKLYYIYKVLLIGILLFVRRYIIYSLKYALKSFSAKYKTYLADGHILIPYIYWFNRKQWLDDDDKIDEPEEDEEDDDDDDYHPGTMMCIPLKTFAKFQAWSIIHDINRRIEILTSQIFKEKIKKKYGIPKEMPFMAFLRTELYKNKVISLEAKINNIVQIALILEYYDTTKEKKIYKNIFGIIYTLYFLCWTHILYKSIMIFTYNPKTDDILFESLIKFIEPFSGLLLL